MRIGKVNRTETEILDSGSGVQQSKEIATSSAVTFGEIRQNSVEQDGFQEEMKIESILNRKTVMYDEAVFKALNTKTKTKRSKEVKPK